MSQRCLMEFLWWNDVLGALSFSCSKFIKFLWVNENSMKMNHSILTIPSLKSDTPKYLRLVLYQLIQFLNIFIHYHNDHKFVLGIWCGLKCCYIYSIQALLFMRGHHNRTNDDILMQLAIYRIIPHYAALFLAARHINWIRSVMAEDMWVKPGHLLVDPAPTMTMHSPGIMKMMWFLNTSTSSSSLRTFYEARETAS